MLTNIVLTIIFWIFYFFIHSFLANRFVKNRLISDLHLSNKAYRLLYSSISMLCLLPIFYFLSVTKSDFLLPQTQMLKFISLALSTWGVIIVKMAFKNYRLREFLGFKDAPDQLKLAQSGILKYVRHPIYSGTILLFMGFWLFIPNVLNLVTVICTFLYLPIGIRLEEQKLEEEYGDFYRRYKEKVPALIPDLAHLFKSNQR